MLVLLIAVAATGGLVLLALAIALLVQLRRVSTTVAALNRELTPLLAQIREDAERARDRLEDLAARHSEEAGATAAPAGRR
jgi:hypothetical protein